MIPTDADTDLWLCPNCGGENGLFRDACVYCGGERPQDARRITPSNVFYHDPQYADFEQNRQRFIQKTQGTATQMRTSIVPSLVIMAIFTSVVMALFREGLGTILCINAIIALAGLGLLRIPVQMLDRFAVLFRDGIVLPGEIVACTLNTHSEDCAYALEIRYSFITPAGERLTNTQNKCRDGVESKADLPAQGTPVRVLYLTDRNYLLL